MNISSAKNRASDIQGCERNAIELGGKPYVICVNVMEQLAPSLLYFQMAFTEEVQIN